MSEKEKVIYQEDTDDPKEATVATWDGVVCKVTSLADDLDNMATILLFQKEIDAIHAALHADDPQATRQYDPDTFIGKHEVIYIVMNPDGELERTWSTEDERGNRLALRYSLDPSPRKPVKAERTCGGCGYFHDGFLCYTDPDDVHETDRNRPACRYWEAK